MQRMGTSFYERNNFSAPSLNWKEDGYHRHDDLYQNVKSSLEKGRRKKPSPKKEQHRTSIRDSLEKFLFDSKDEDLLFQKSIIFDGNNGGDERRDPDQIDGLFDRNASKAAVNKSTKQSRPRKNDAGRKQKQEELAEASLSRLFESSLNKIFDDDEPSQESERNHCLSDLKSRNKIQKQLGMSQSGTSRRLPTRSLDKGQASSTQRRERRRPRSEMGRKTHINNKTKNENNNNKTKNENNDLFRGLSNLDRQVRRDRMKKEYRSRSIDPRGGESVVSGMSKKSTYKRTGFEGGALNAIMGNESFARLACRGEDFGSLSGSASLASGSTGEQYMKERKARQEGIIGVVKREKRLCEEKDEAKRLEKDKIKAECNPPAEELWKKQKVFVRKIKRAVSMTKNVSKPDARVAANADMDPKRSGKKVSKADNQVEMGTGKIIKDPSSGAKRSSKGEKGTANVAKGNFEATSHRSKKGSSKTRVKKTSNEKKERDPGSLSERQSSRGTFAKRIGVSNERERRNRSRINSTPNSPTEILSASYSSGMSSSQSISLCDISFKGASPSFKKIYEEDRVKRTSKDKKERNPSLLSENQSELFSESYSSLMASPQSITWRDISFKATSPWFKKDSEKKRVKRTPKEKKERNQRRNSKEKKENNPRLSSERKSRKGTSAKQAGVSYESEQQDRSRNNSTPNSPMELLSASYSSDMAASHSKDWWAI